MSAINTTRLALGGLVAGVVLNTCDFIVNNYVMAGAWQNLAQGHNIDQASMGSTESLVTFVIVDMLLGFMIMWLYAAIRPRYGAGPSTAMKAALAVWGVVILTSATFSGWFLSWDLILKSGGLALVSYLGAGLAAGYLYQELDQAPATDEWFQK